MPKFLDVPQWYNSNGTLTSGVSSYSYLITVHYQDGSETNEVTAYFPISLQGIMTPFSPPFSYFFVIAMLSQETQNVPCWGIMRKGASSSAISAVLTYAEITGTEVTFHGNYVDTNYPYKIINITFTMSQSDNYTSTLIPSFPIEGYLSK